MSAFAHFADSSRTSPEVREVPNLPNSGPQEDLESTLFDHFVGKCEQRVRYVEPYRLCGFQIEHEQEVRWLLDWQVGGFSAFEDAIDQGGRTLENLAPVRSIRHQAAFTS